MLLRFGTPRCIPLVWRGGCVFGAFVVWHRFERRTSNRWSRNTCVHTSPTLQRHWLMLPWTAVCLCVYVYVCRCVCVYVCACISHLLWSIHESIRTNFRSEELYFWSSSHFIAVTSYIFISYTINYRDEKQTEKCGSKAYYSLAKQG